MPSAHTLSTLAEVLGLVVSRHGSVRDDGGHWLADEPVYSADGTDFLVHAELHPGDARDAARDVLDLLAARGFTLQREVRTAGNSLATRLLRAAVALLAAPDDPARVGGVADLLCTLAAEARDRDDAVVPAHLRLPASGLPDGVARLCDRRRA